MRQSANGRKALYLLIISIILMVALTVASYAWMTLSSTPSVTDLGLTVITESALELSSDNGGKPAGDWTTIMDLADVMRDIELKPITYSASRDAFFAPRYGFDGRVSAAAGIRLTDEKGALLPEFAAADGQSNGYLYIYDFWIRTNSSDCTVALTAPVDREDGKLGAGTFLVGEPVWNASSVSHTNAGNGAQFAMRMAFRVDSVDDQGDIDESAMILYEPNADGGKGYSLTESADGNGLLQGSNPLIQQAVSTWKETNPVLRDSVIYTHGDFMTEDLSLFKLKTGHARHVTLYIWLETQDYDCTNDISAGRILANVQFDGITDEKENNIRPD